MLSKCRCICNEEKKELYQRLFCHANKSLSITFINKSVGKQIDLIFNNFRRCLPTVKCKQILLAHSCDLINNH